MRNLEDNPGLKVNGKMINNLRYADDTVLIAENEKDLQNLLDIVSEESKKLGLELNSKKTEVMVISRKKSPRCELYVEGTVLKQKTSFKYLGTIISQDGRNDSEIKARISQAKQNFQKMKSLLTNTKMSIATRKRILQCYIEPILMYGCEAWTISKQTKKKLEAVEMWFLRRMLRVPWTARKTNIEVLKETNTRRSLISRLRKRQAQFVGHIMRRDGLENLITTGKLEGRRARGRQREKILDGLATWMEKDKTTDMLLFTRDWGV